MEAWQGRQRPQVHLLTLRLTGIVGARIEERGEVADPVDGVLGEESLGESAKVQPLERSTSDGTVVEVETVDVEVRDQSLLPYKDRDHPGGRSRPCRRSDRGGNKNISTSDDGSQSVVRDSNCSELMRRMPAERGGAALLEGECSIW